MSEGLFLVILGITSFMFCLCIGGLFAWALGYDVNEPEYYEHRRRTDEAD